MPREKTQRQSLIFIALAVEGGLLLVALACNWFFRLSLALYIKWSSHHLILGIIATAPMLAAFILAVKWPIGPLKTIRDRVNELIVPLFRQCSTFDLAWISCLAGVAEEVAFRGVLQLGLERMWSPVPAILVSAAVFGILHCVTVTYAIGAMIVGLYFSLLFFCTENLTVVIIAHALYDFCALYYLCKENDENSDSCSSPLSD